MFRTAAVLGATTALVLGASAGPAQADVEAGPLPEHGHVLVLGLEFGDDRVTFRKCIDIAAGQALPLTAQHQNVHFGHAGEALFTKAGHAFVPVAPFPGIPFANCADLERMFG